jgi:hypothetical protein
MSNAAPRSTGKAARKRGTVSAAGLSVSQTAEGAVRARQDKSTHSHKIADISKDYSLLRDKETFLTENQ